MRGAPLDDDELGHGAQAGVLRPDHGDGWAELRCDNCGAGWVGVIGEPCGWCADRLERRGPATNGHRLLEGRLVDWEEFVNRGSEGPEWLAEPLLPAHRGAVIYSPAGVGKSLIALWIAARLAHGRAPFTDDRCDPVRVLYVDYEMTADDLEERLEGMDLLSADALAPLGYMLHAQLPPLDEEAGGQLMVGMAAEHDADLVVLDTFGRAVRGEENDADTTRAFYRHCGASLKAAGRAWLRVDHAGKDATRGQRGSSAKNDDVDVVWRMTRREGGYLLRNEKRRVGWVPLSVALAFEGDDEIRFGMTEQPAPPPRTTECAVELDDLAVPLEVTFRQASAALRGAGSRYGNEVIAAAIKLRRRTPDAWQDDARNAARDEVPAQQQIDPRSAAGNESDEPASSQVAALWNAAGNALEQSAPDCSVFPPSLDGEHENGPGSDADRADDADEWEMW